MTKLKLVREKYKKAEAERTKELNERKAELIDPEEPDPHHYLGPPPKKPQTDAQVNKTIKLKKQLQNLVRQAQLNKVTEREIKEKTFETITERLVKVEKAVKQTDEDLSKKLELIYLKKNCVIPRNKKSNFYPRT